MKDLLPQEVIEELLLETGAYEEVRPTHLIKTGTFRNFSFKKKVKTDFNLKTIEEVLDQYLEKNLENWKELYDENCTMVRKPAEMIDVKRYKFREQAFCIEVNCSAIQDPFLIYFGKNTFFVLLNKYLGGGQIRSDKSSEDFTTIEAVFLKKEINQLMQILQNTFQKIFDFDLSVGRVNLTEKEQKSYFNKEFLVEELILNLSNQRFIYSICLPQSFLGALKNYMENASGGDQEDVDPLWQDTVIDAFMTSAVDLKAHIGDFSIPFEKSLNLQVGDVFPWEKQNTQVTVYYEGKPHMVGSMGVQGENYAIKVNEVFGD